MASFIIEGGYKLHGEIKPQGAKNEALEVISAVLLTDEPVLMHNIPNILDVNNLIGIMSKIGVHCKDMGGGTWEFRANNLDMDYLASQEFVQRQVPPCVHCQARRRQNRTTQARHPLLRRAENGRQVQLRR